METQRLDDQVILIANGATGFGQSCVDFCSSRGAKVAANLPLQSQAPKGKIDGAQLDVGYIVGDLEKGNEIVEAAISKFGGLQALIYEIPIIETQHSDREVEKRLGAYREVEAQLKRAFRVC